MSHTHPSPRGSSQATSPVVDRRRLLVGLALAGPALVACEDPFSSGRAPLIEGVRPERGRVGQQVTIVGRRFGLRGDRDGVWLAGVEMPVESWTDVALLVRVPRAVAGVADVVVRSGPWVSAPYPFEVLASPADDGVGDIIP